MAVKKLESVEEIAKLLGVKDDVEKYFPCSHGEWIQWLVSQAENEKIAIWANTNKNDVMDSYVVVFNTVSPPLSRHCFIPYAWSVLGRNETQVGVNEIVKWAQSTGADVIRMMCSEEKAEMFEKYGFKKKAIVMELKIDAKGCC